MRYLQRELLRFLGEERKMALVAGPRQVGKTTLVKNILALEGPSTGYFNWDIESHRKAVLRNPESFWGSAARIALDEIHKYPRWKRFLKGLHDATAPAVEILVTGSGRLDVYQRGGDSLFGRYGLYRLHPFTLGEVLDPGRGPLPPKALWSQAL
ncbi:MAG: AAA family ATPase, partial [Elusimicrobiota bacterium]